MHYLALCAIAKDEDKYLQEWIHYHVLIGVERFIIYDNGSATPIQETLAGHVRTGLVTVIPFRGKDRQIPAYDHCLHEFGSNFRWIGFLDLDEFLVLKDTQDARILLSEYEDFGGLAVNWVMFGSSGHVTSPKGLQIENYVLRRPSPDLHVKSIVQPRHATAARNAHQFLYKPARYCVNADRLPVGGSLSYAASRRIQINHYWCRSQQDYAAKLQRGRADVSALNESTRKWDIFYAHLAQPHIHDEGLNNLTRKLNILSRRGDPRIWAELAGSHSGGRELFQYIDDAAAAVKRGDLDAAERILCAASLHYAETVEYLLFRSSVCRLRKAWDRALAYASAALAREPSLSAYYEVFLIHLQKGDKRIAKQMLAFLEASMETYRIEDSGWKERMILSRKMLASIDMEQRSAMIEMD